MRNSKRFSDIAAAAVTLLPVIAGLILWDRLPEQIPVHWGLSGEPDRYGSRAVFVFLFPLLMLALHFFACHAPKKAKNRSAAAEAILFWLVPALSVFISAMVYIQTLAPDFPVMRILPIFLGLLFLCIGNILPKCPYSRTTGIRLPWTLASEKNWFATHRFAGRIWMIGGFLMLFCPLLPAAAIPPVMLTLLIGLLALTAFYSWRFSRKEK